MAFFHADGRQHQNHRLWSDGTNHGTLFHLEEHLHKLFGQLFGIKSGIFTQPKVYDAKTKSLMCQKGLFTICLRLVHDVLDMSKSTSTYCWSHLFRNSGNLVAHLIAICFTSGENEQLPMSVKFATRAKNECCNHTNWQLLVSHEWNRLFFPTYLVTIVLSLSVLRQENSWFHNCCYFPVSEQTVKVQFSLDVLVKIHFIALKQLQTALWIVDAFLFLIDCEQTRSIFKVSAISRNFNLRSVKTILWIF